MSDSIKRKRLDDDCLLGDSLHPNIAERLERIRQLPVTAAAHLHGVQQDELGAWLLWEFVPGQSLEAMVAAGIEPHVGQQIAQNLKQAVVAIHAHGIVHGAIHERNVILDTAGRVRLTHFSPFLWSDPLRDEADLAAVIRRLNLPDSDGHSSPDKPIDRPTRAVLYLQALAVLMGGILIVVGILWYIGHWGGASG